MLQTFCLLAVLFPLLISDLPLCSLSHTNTDRRTEKLGTLACLCVKRTVKSNNNELPQDGNTVTEFEDQKPIICLNNDPLTALHCLLK